MVTYFCPPRHARKIISICNVIMLTCNIAIISTYAIKILLTCNFNYVALQLNYFYTSKHVACRHKLYCMYGADFLFRYGMRFSLKENLITPVGCVLCITNSNSEKLLLPSHSIVWLQWHPFPSSAKKP